MFSHYPQLLKYHIIILKDEKSLYPSFQTIFSKVESRTNNEAIVNLKYDL